MTRLNKTTALTCSALIFGLTLGGVALAHEGEGGKGKRGGGPAMMLMQADINGDGKVTSEEFDAAKMARFTNADSDGDGFLSKEELGAAAQAHQEHARPKREERRYQKALKRMDSDNDGKLSIAEMAQGPRPDMFAHILERLDEDGDGALSMQELEQMAQHRGRRAGHGQKSY